MAERTPLDEWEAEPPAGPVAGGRRDPSQEQIYRWAETLREERPDGYRVPEPNYPLPRVAAVLLRGESLDRTVLGLLKTLGSANRHTLARLTACSTQEMIDCVERLRKDGEIVRGEDGLYLVAGLERCERGAVCEQ